MRVLRRRKIARNFPFGFDEGERCRYNAALVGQLAQLVEQRIENPRVRGSIPRLATTELKLKAHSSEWAFCYLAFVMEWGDVAFSKYSMLVLLTVALIAFLWRFGRAVCTGVTKWILWALAALCACAGLVAVLSSEGRPLPIIGGVVLWAFAAYVIKVAGVSRKAS